MRPCVNVSSDDEVADSPAPASIMPRPSRKGIHRHPIGIEASNPLPIERDRSSWTKLASTSSEVGVGFD